VDADGNEVGGIVLPELAAPLATHTGWNLRHPDIGGAAQLLVLRRRHAAVREDAAGARNRPAIRDRPSPSATVARGLPGARPLRRNGAREGRLPARRGRRDVADVAARMWDAWA